MPESRNCFGGPFWFQHDDRRELGVLLVHGFLACPEELRPLARQLFGLGVEVLGVRLPGHGTSPMALARTSASDWLNAVTASYRALAKRCARVVVLGFSTGGLLALRLASQRPPGLAGVVSVCAPAAFTDRSMELVPLLHSGVQLWQSLSGREQPVFRISHPEYPRVNYRNMPVSALASLHALVEESADHLLRVEAPVMLFQASRDPVVSPESMTLLAQNLPIQTQSHWIISDRHNILRADPGPVIASIKKGIRKWRDRPA